ncbi:hypothetical protein K523DRAFT_320063, partial [Schizophyllum commune Tattone D]
MPRPQVAVNTAHTPANDPSLQFTSPQVVPVCFYTATLACTPPTRHQTHASSRPSASLSAQYS